MPARWRKKCFHKTVILQIMVNYSIDTAGSQKNLLVRVVRKPTLDWGRHSLRRVDMTFIRTVLYVTISMDLFGLWNT